VYEWMDAIPLPYPYVRTPDMVAVAKKMMAYEPESRPTAPEIQSGVGEVTFHDIFSPQSCCGLPPEQYVAYEEKRFGMRDRQSSDVGFTEAVEEHKAAEDFRVLFGNEEPPKADGMDDASNFTLFDLPKVAASSIFEEFSSLGKSDLTLYELGSDQDILMEEAQNLRAEEINRG
jgi:hypothetical protein